MHRFYGIIGFIFLMWSCKSAQSIPTETETALFKAAIEKQHFRIESDWAYPQVSNTMQQLANARLLPPGSSASAISLIGNPNVLTVSGDSITSYLPYFGERQMQVDYGGADNAIEFMGIMENYTITKDKKSSYTIRFDANSNDEGFKVIIKLYPNATAHMQLIGNSRFPISYLGKLSDVNVE